MEVSIRTKKVMREVSDDAIKDSGIFIDLGHADSPIKGYLDFVDDTALNVIFLVDCIDCDAVLADYFCNLCFRYVVDSE